MDTSGSPNDEEEFFVVSDNLTSGSLLYFSSMIPAYLPTESGNYHQGLLHLHDSIIHEILKCLSHLRLKGFDHLGEELRMKIKKSFETCS